MRRTEIPWVDVADATRREIVNDLFVERESFEPIAATMNRLREDHREGKETSCMSIVGVPGVGKSQLLKRYAAANGMITETTSDGISRRLPVLYAELDSNITVNDAAETILRALLGKRAPGGSTIKNRVLPDQLEIWRVELLIIDEFQHVGERGRSKTRNATADWIKSIAKKLRIPVVMAGKRAMCFTFAGVVPKSRLRASAITLANTSIVSAAGSMGNRFPASARRFRFLPDNDIPPSLE